ncbi:spermidine synthase-like protein [Niveibacterium sp.]|uniref:spermine/spermidine synthase domain-containing protein n=1 Tax=Niveibacterium sp. TaxID=2017444 RepID=UPI0035B21A9D
MSCNDIPSPIIHTRTSIPLADSRAWTAIPAAFLFEQGTLILHEPVGSDVHALLTQLLDGDYRRPFMVDDGAIRRLHFSLAFVQSEMLIDDPLALQLGYTRKMMAGMLFNPSPEHVCIVGLGGGSLTKFWLHHHPDTVVTTVEINEDVIAFAPWFGVPTGLARAPIVHIDAYDYFQQPGPNFDVVMLDGFDLKGIAPRLCDEAFYVRVRDRLKPGGVLVMNLAGPTAIEEAHLSIVRSVFNDQVIVHEVEVYGNRVVFAFDERWFSPDWTAVERTATALAHTHQLDYPAFARKLRRSYGLKREQNRSREFRGSLG